MFTSSVFLCAAFLGASLYVFTLHSKLGSTSKSMAPQCSTTSSQKPHRVPLSYEPWWHCKKAVYCWTKPAISFWICIFCCWGFFQAVPAADPAHILWRCCHGSALCHCWLNMEETPSLALPNTKIHHWRDILYSTNPSYLVFLIHGNFILIKLSFLMWH